MLSKSYLLILLLALSLQTYAQFTFPSTAIPVELKRKANAVVRDMETIIDMRAKDQVVISVKKVVTVLNKNGDDAAALLLFYNRSSVIKNVKGEIYNDFGIQVAKFSQAQFKDESAVSGYSLFEDDRVKYYQPAMVTYPYTIIYEYEVRNSQNLLIPDWYPRRESEVAVEKSRYQFISKPEDELNIKSYHLKEGVTKTSTEKLISYTWQVNGLAAFADEPYSPEASTYLSHVKIAPVKFSYYKAHGEYKNWAELGSWMYKDLIAQRQTLPPATIERIRALVNGIKDPKAQAKKIYEYMQQKTRYVSVQVGIGGFQPAPAAEVDVLGYGDCKGLVNYMQSLLKAVGIPSYYCIVYAGSEKRGLDPEFASMNQANHVILCLPFENDTTWLECTSQTAPFGFLGDFTDDRLVLACTKNGGKLLRTPALNTLANLATRSVKMQVDKTGNLQGTMVTTAKGAQYDNDELLGTQSKDDQLKSLQEQYDIDNIEFTGASFKQIRDHNPVTEVKSTFNIKSYISTTENRAYLVLNPFNKMNALREISNRTKNLYINRGFVDEDEINYVLPDHFTLELKPKDVKLTNEFGTYTATLSIEGNVLRYKRKLLVNNGVFNPERYSSFVSFINEVSQHDRSKVIFTIHQ